MYRRRMLEKVVNTREQDKTHHEKNKGQVNCLHHYFCSRNCIQFGRETSADSTASPYKCAAARV